VAAPALAADEPEDDQGPYPIWWSPELGVESLGDVDSELDKPFPTEKQFYLSDQWLVRAGIVSARTPLFGLEHMNKRLVGNCADWNNWHKKGFVFAYKKARQFVGKLYAPIAFRCQILDALRTGSPTRISHLNDGEWIAELENLLPAFLAWGGSCREFDAVVNANKDGVPAVSFPFTRMTTYLRNPAKDPAATVLRFEAKPYEKWKENYYLKPRVLDFDLQILAKGDFDGDGVEDVILRKINDWSEEILGKFPQTLYLLTRLKKDAILRVLKIYDPLTEWRGSECPPGPDDFKFGDDQPSEPPGGPVWWSAARPHCPDGCPPPSIYSGVTGAGTPARSR